MSTKAGLLISFLNSAIRKWGHMKLQSLMYKEKGKTAWKCQINKKKTKIKTYKKWEFPISFENTHNLKMTQIIEE